MIRLAEGEQKILSRYALLYRRPFCLARRTSRESPYALSVPIKVVPTVTCIPLLPRLHCDCQHGHSFPTHEYMMSPLLAFRIAFTLEYQASVLNTHHNANAIISTDVDNLINLPSRSTYAAPNPVSYSVHKATQTAAFFKCVEVAYLAP